MPWTETARWRVSAQRASLRNRRDGPGGGADRAFDAAAEAPGPPAHRGSARDRERVILSIATTGCLGAMTRARRSTGVNPTPSSIPSVCHTAVSSMRRISRIGTARRRCAPRSAVLPVAVLRLRRRQLCGVETARCARSDLRGDDRDRQALRHREGLRRSTLPEECAPSPGSGDAADGPRIGRNPSLPPNHGSTPPHPPHPPAPRTVLLSLTEFRGGP